MINSKTAVQSGGKGEKNQHIYIKNPHELGKECCLPASTAEFIGDRFFENSTLFFCTFWLKYKQEERQLRKYSKLLV